MTEGGAPTGPSAQRALHSLPLVYLLGVASGGLYLLLWIARIARDLGAADSHPRRPIGWALGSLAPPVGFCVLHELADRADAGRIGPGGFRWPALLYAALESGLFLSEAPWIVGALLRPLPALWIQHAWNRERDRVQAATPIGRPPSRALGVAVTAFGAALLCLQVWISDVPQIRRWQATALAADALVEAPDGTFQIRIPTDGWRRSDPETLGDGQAILTLLGPAEGVEVYIFRHAAESDLDTVVDRRRALLRNEGNLVSAREERSFVEGPVLRARSLAVYRTDEISATQSLVVLTSVDDATAVELVAVAPRGGPIEEDLVRLARSFAWLPDGGANP